MGIKLHPFPNFLDLLEIDPNSALFLLHLGPHSQIFGPFLCVSIFLHNSWDLVYPASSLLRPFIFHFFTSVQESSLSPSVYFDFCWLETGIEGNHFLYSIRWVWGQCSTFGINLFLYSFNNLIEHPLNLCEYSEETKMDKVPSLGKLIF